MVAFCGFVRPNDAPPTDLVVITCRLTSGMLRYHHPDRRVTEVDMREHRIHFGELYEGSHIDVATRLIRLIEEMRQPPCRIAFWKAFDSFNCELPQLTELITSARQPGFSVESFLAVHPLVQIDLYSWDKLVFMVG